VGWTMGRWTAPHRAIVVVEAREKGLDDVPGSTAAA
jgi:hypothetical protein